MPTYVAYIIVTIRKGMAKSATYRAIRALRSSWGGPAGDASTVPPSGGALVDGSTDCS